MKLITILFILFSFSLKAQVDIPVTGKVTVTASNATKLLIAKKADQKSLDSLKAEVSKIKGGVKGDPGPMGIQGLPGRDGRDGTGGSSVNEDELNRKIDSILLKKSFSFPYSLKSVKDFGAVGNNSVDDYPAIQAAIYFCIKNNIRVCFVPVGRYRITHPLLIMSPTGGFVTLELLGESSFWDANIGSEIWADFTDAFAIGIQLGKGCKIRKISIHGKFTPPSMADRRKFFNTKFEDFKDGVCSDKKYAPYSAIVIDPFTTNVNSPIPPDGGYTRLRQYYSTTTWSPQTGSTGIEIEEIDIRNFVVGIITSPNGVTRNAEIVLINKIQFTSMKLCIAGTQDQEKNNTVTNLYCWGNTHTIFATGLYGDATPSSTMSGNWVIDRVNIAGGVVRFIYQDHGGYFPSYISHVFAESLGTFGTLQGGLASQVQNVHIDFETPDVIGEQTLIVTWGKNIVYRSCNFRFYGMEGRPMYILGTGIFENCYFTGPRRNEGAPN